MGELIDFVIAHESIVKRMLKEDRFDQDEAVFIKAVLKMRKKSSKFSSESYTQSSF